LNPVLNGMIQLDILQVVGIGIIATIIIVILKTWKPEAAIQVSIAAGVAIFMVLAGKLSAIIELLGKYAEKAGVGTVYFGILLKIIGVAYIAEFGAEVCKDAGESAIASKIELAGKVAILVLAVPIVTSLLDLIINLMP
jgi:stage III sporulation protein AD